MLYTGKGDDGKTRLFGVKAGDRIYKDSYIIECLGALDELNSFLGLVKVKSLNVPYKLDNYLDKKKKYVELKEIIEWMQNILFIIQAEVAGADKKVKDSHVKVLNLYVNTIEKQLPPIKTFFISGGDELTALMDISRTLARRVERYLVRVERSGEVKLGRHTKAFANRLSSALYALTRLNSYKSGINEVVPSY